ncbi:MAG TPA: hypothetical protein VGH58_01380 [Solirubrobacterales bacterium]
MLIRVASFLAALALGLLIGRTTAPSTSVPAPTSAEDGGARTRLGIPVGFPRTPAGAATAVAAYERSFASPAILRPGVLRERIEAVATPDYVAQMLAANSPGEKRIAAGPIGEGLASGLQTLYAAVPIGYRVESFGPERARVLTWGFTLLGNASAVEPAAYFGLTHTELIWSQGEWKIAETRAGFGPTPKLATSPGPLGGYGVMGIATRLKSYALAP